MDKTIKICRDKKAFDNANDGDLIYLSGQYDMSKDKGFDSDFDMRFKDSIIKRSYEKFQRSYTRLLNEDETITKENNLNSNDVKNYDHEKHHLRYLKTTNKWVTIKSVNNNVSVPSIKIKLNEGLIEINTNHITQYGTGFTKIELIESDAINAKPLYDGKYKYISYGMLYYSSNSFISSSGDIRMTYYKLKTEDKISVIGEKKGNEIIPKKNLPGYENTPIFKSSGDIYSIDEFLTLLKDEAHSSFVSMLIAFIIILIIGLGMLLWSLKC